jgi:hypothetical protein
MATINLISKSLGGVLVESGNGIPNHTSPIGSYYTNKDTGTIHINVDSSTGWDALNRVSYGEIYINGNTTATTVGVINTWYLTTALSWTQGSVNGVTLSGGTLTVGAGRGGKYEVISEGTLDYVAASNFEFGISKNSGTPITGLYQGVGLSATILTSCVTVNGFIDLAPGDTISVVVRNIVDTSNVILKHGGVILNRVGD